MSPFDYNVPDFPIGKMVRTGSLKIGDHLFSEICYHVIEVVLTKDCGDGYYEVTPVLKGHETFRISQHDTRYQPTLQRALYYALNHYKRTAKDAMLGVSKMRELIDKNDCSYYPCFVKKPNARKDGKK